MTMSTSGDTQMLPVEILDTVFQLAAFSTPESIPAIALVSKRVRACVDPILYGHVLSTSSRTLQRFLDVESRPKVHSMEVYMTIQPIRGTELLQKCPNLRRLALWAGPSIRSFLSSPNPSHAPVTFYTRLAALPHLRVLFIRLCQSFEEAVCFTSPALSFEFLTHIFLDGYRFFVPYSGAQIMPNVPHSFPAITHVAIDAQQSKGWSDEAMQRGISLWLPSQTLQRFIIVAPLHSPESELGAYIRSLSWANEMDHRIVSVTVNWAAAGRNRLDFLDDLWRMGDEEYVRKIAPN